LDAVDSLDCVFFGISFEKKIHEFGWPSSFIRNKPTFHACHPPWGYTRRAHSSQQASTIPHFGGLCFFVSGGALPRWRLGIHPIVIHDAIGYFQKP